MLFSCRVLLAILCCPSSARTVDGQHVVHVRAGADGANNGSTWKNAHTDLQDALTVAQEGDEIWIAAGIYKPDRGTGDRAQTFQLVSGVGLYGGFAGWETERAQRNPAKNETILSGDLAGNDGPRDCAEHSDCCYEHENAGCDNAVCEALVCGLDSYCCDPSLSNDRWDWYCVWIAGWECCDLGSWNSCENSYFVVTARGTDSSTILDGLTITGAYADDVRDGFDVFAAGIYCESGNLSLSNCVIRGNASYGLFAWESSNLTLTDCSFVDNVSAGLSIRDGDSVLTGCRFTGNLTGMSGSGTLNLTRCTFRENTSRGLSIGGDAEITDCAFIGNEIAASVRSGRFVVSDCVFIENLVGLGIGDSSAIVRNCDFVGTGAGGALGTSYASVSVVGCVFRGNTGGRAGAIRQQAGVLTVSNSLFTGNQAGSFGGSGTIAISSEGRATLTNCTLSGNYNPWRYTGGIQVNNGSATLANCILWGNHNTEGSGESAQFELWYGSDSTVTINHSVVQGWTGIHGGVGNSGVDPLFVDADGWDKIPGTEDDDLRLTADSPCIDAGNPVFTPRPGETDYAGHPRVLCGRVDIGAYEFGMGDFDCDTVADLTDFAAWDNCMTGPDSGPFPAGCEAFDFNADSDVDMNDYTAILRILSGP